MTIPLSSFTHLLLSFILPSPMSQIFAKENSGTYNCEWMMIDATQHSFHVLDQVSEKGRKDRKERRDEGKK